MYSDIEKIEIKKIIPSIIDNVFIGMIDGYHTLVLPIGMSNISYSQWKKGRGFVFSKDVKLYKENKKTGYYSIISNNETNTIIRLIEPEEMPDFISKKLVDGKIGDISYMILKTVKDINNLTDREIELYNINLLDNFENEHILISEGENAEEEEEDNMIRKTLSLLDD